MKQIHLNSNFFPTNFILTKVIKLMKVFLYFLIFSFFSMTLNAQIKAFEDSEVVQFPKEGRMNIKYNQWYKKSASSTIIEFKQNTVGIMTAILKIKEILDSNNIDFNNPSQDKSYLAS
ncbi:hypothetical protein, partial [Enterobacter cloacae complex sp. 4DZ1-17B1]|uniref:hypothetical protein n=1 Tax=Enterobacter cloacae complex sp. 4DZ1-17B1 TaxID=2511991 RepID=UPI0013EE2DED